MKKLFAILLAVMMMATMSVSAFAATPIDGDNATSASGIGADDYTIGVNGTYNAGSGAADEIVSVDISWEGMEFTFTAGDITYDPTTHENKQSNGEWSNANENGKGSVTVRNHSNVEIDATFKFTAATDLTVTGCFFTKVENESGVGDPSYLPISGEANQKLHLESALGKARADKDSTKDQTPTDTIYFAITDGSITAEQSSLGTITVKIAKDTWTRVSTEAELESAVASGGNIKLMHDITAGENSDYVDLANGTVLDLNGKTLTALLGMTKVGNNGYEIKNGTLNNGTLEEGKTEYVSKYVAYSDMFTITDCTINAGSETEGSIVVYGTLILSGTIDLNNPNDSDNLIQIKDEGTVTCLAGTYNFNPGAYVDAGDYDVTANANNTWTVTAKTPA